MFDINLLVPKIIWLLSAATLASHLAIVLAAAIYFFGLHKREPFKKYFEILRKNALWLAFLIAFSAVAGSQAFSGLADFQPCALCWWQRVFLYPQVIVLGLALWQRDHGVRKYAISLSLIGASIAAYQYLLTTLTPASALGICSATGPSCLTNYFTSFGYITTPLMSFTSFVLIIILSFIWKQDDRSIINNS